MKLNFGCGKQTWDGWFCVDAVKHPKATRDPDLLHALEFDKDGALLNPLPLPDGCCDELSNFHFIEHVHEWESPAVIREFRRLLKPGGLLVLECPDLELAAKNLLAGLPPNMWRFPFYGDGGLKDPLMCHKHGYTKASIAELVLANGFKTVKHRAPMTHGARINRDMRIEAR
jgi:predicted SAM-dependent methyltransferase